MSRETTKRPFTSRISGYTILRYGLAAIFLFAGAGKLVGLAAVQQTFEHFGYSQDFRVVIGVLETAGAIGLLIPGLVFWAALGLSGVMVGAIWSHVLHDPLFMALPATAVLAGLVAIAWRRSPAPAALRERPMRDLRGRSD